MKSFSRKTMSASNAAWVTLSTESSYNGNPAIKRRCGSSLDYNSTFKTSHSIYKYWFLFDQTKGLIYRYIIHSIPLPEFDPLLLASFRCISKPDF
jgi:hypothetical protein